MHVLNALAQTGKCKHGDTCRFKHENNGNGVAGLSEWNSSGEGAHSTCPNECTAIEFKVGNVSNNTKTPDQIDLWAGTMDSGAQVHVSGDRSVMHDIVRLCSETKLTCADGSTSHAAKFKGKIKLN